LCVSALPDLLHPTGSRAESIRAFSHPATDFPSAEGGDYPPAEEGGSVATVAWRTVVCPEEWLALFTLVARKGTAGPGGKKFDLAVAPWINDSGAVVFQDQPYDTTDGTSVYLWDKGTITAIATPDMDAPGGGKITNAEYPVIDNDGDMAFRGTVDGVEALFAYRKATGKLVLIAKAGTDLGGGVKFTQVEGNRRHAVEINNKGVVVASVWIGDGDDGGVMTYNMADGKTAILAKTGDTLSNVGKIEAMANGRGGISSFKFAINDNDDILFVAKIGDLESVILATAP
jgi:hypothetical protein